MGSGGGERLRGFWQIAHSSYPTHQITSDTHNFTISKDILFCPNLPTSKNLAEEQIFWGTDPLGAPGKAGQSIYKTELTFHSFISNSWRRQEFKKRSIPPKISCKIWLTEEMCRNIFLIFLWNIFAETKFSGLLPNPSSGDFITLKVDRKCGMRKHEKVILDWFWELKVYFKLGTAILAWRMFVTWVFSSNSLHNVAFIKYWRNDGDSRSLPFFLPSPSPLSFFRPRTYCKGYYFYSPQSSIVIKSKMAATTILRTRTRFRAPKIRLHCRLVCNGLGGNVWYFPVFFNA